MKLFTDNLQIVCKKSSFTVVGILRGSVEFVNYDTPIIILFFTRSTHEQILYMVNIFFI